MKHDEALFNLTNDKIVAASPNDASDRHDRPVLDYALRMAIAHTVFWAHISFSINQMTWTSESRCLRFLKGGDQFKESKCAHIAILVSSGVLWSISAS